MTNKEASEWFKKRAQESPMPGAREAFKLAAEALANADVPDNNVGDLISKQAAIDAIWKCRPHEAVPDDHFVSAVEADCLIRKVPSAQPEIIRCNSCKYWTQSTGKMKGYGLGRCDFHDADLVACNGFCYWAERRTDE